MGYRSWMCLAAGLILPLIGQLGLGGEPKLGSKYRVTEIRYSGSHSGRDVANPNAEVTGDMTLIVEEYREPPIGAQPKPPQKPKMTNVCMGVIDPPGAQPAPQPEPLPQPPKPGQYQINVPFQTTLCQNDVTAIAENLGRYGNVIQLVNREGIPKRDDNGTPSDPNDDVFTLGGKGGFQIDRVIASGMVPDGFTDAGYGPTQTGRGYLVRRADFDSGLHPECGNRMLCTDHMVLHLDDPADPNNIVSRVDVLLPPDTGDAEGRRIAAGFAGRTVWMTGEPIKSPYNDRLAVALDQVRIGDTGTFRVERNVQEPKVVPPAKAPRK